MVARGLVKELDYIERIDLSYLYFMLKDHAIELEIQRSFYDNIITLTANSNSPDKFSILDNIQKLYNSHYKTSMEKLIENYKTEFESGKSRQQQIKFNPKDKRKVSELVQRLKEK